MPLRDLCRAELPGFTEKMAYGMPADQRDGAGEIAFAQRLAEHDMGKGCLRFRGPEQVDFALVRDLLRATAAEPGTICGPLQDDRCTAANSARRVASRVLIERRGTRLTAGSVTSGRGAPWGHRSSAAPAAGGTGR